MTGKKISVIIPVYNTEQYLVECLDSVVGQNLKDIEVICVDDGSTDHSSAILKQYAQEDDRFKILTTANNGPGAARNLALEKAVGEYVSFVDSDDYIHSDMLLKMYEQAIAHSADLVICAIKKFNDNPRELFSKCSYKQYIPADLVDGNVSFDWADLQENFFKLRFACPNKIYKRKFLIDNNIKFSVEIFYEDMVFVYKALLCANRMRFVRKNLYYNRRQREGATTFTQGERVLGAFTALNELEKFLDENLEFAPLKEQFYAFKFRKLLEYLPRNDAAHIDVFFKKLKAFVKCNADLKDNPYLGNRQRELLENIDKREMMDYIMYAYWELSKRYAILYRKHRKLKKDIKKKSRSKRKTQTPAAFFKRMPGKVKTLFGEYK